MRLIRRWSAVPFLVVAWLGCGNSSEDSTFANTTGGNGAKGGSAGASSGGASGSGGGISIGTGGAGGGGGSGTVGVDGKICGGVDVGVETVPFNMLIMLDQSSSMTDFLDGVAPPTRWEALTSALINYFNSPDAQPISVGLSYFEQFDKTTAMTSCNVADYTTPEVAIAPLSKAGQIAALTNSIKAHSPTGYTPTAAALKGALDHAKTFAMANPGRQTMVVFATDGLPTQCEPRSPIDIGNQIAGPAFQGKPSIRTFVVAAATGLSALGSISQAGGTTAPVFVTDPTKTTTDIQTAFSRLTRTNFSCSYRIPAGGEGGVGAADPSQVNVEIRSNGMMTRTLPLFMSAAGCGDGWYFDNPSNPQNIMLCPSTCSNIFNGELHIVVGCAGPPPM